MLLGKNNSRQFELWIIVCLVDICDVTMARRKKYDPYTEENLRKAVAAINNGMSKRSAARIFKVPRSTLFDKIAGRTIIGKKMGRVPFLTDAEEQSIVR